MNGYAFYTLDVFTDQLFGGNPLAVFPHATGLSPLQMQRIAAEVNYSETVFVLPPETPAGNYRLRIFTPTQELAFAGHPTIGAAYLLGILFPPAETNQPQPLTLEEPVGHVLVNLNYQAGQLQSTALTVAQLPESRPNPLAIADVARLLGLSVADIRQAHDFPQAYSCGLPYLMVPLRDPTALAAVEFNVTQWQALLARAWASCVYCVAPQNKGETVAMSAQLCARMFAPGLGITEDPATGSAVSALGGYCGDRLTTTGQFTWQIIQGVEMGRPSELQLTIVKTPQGLETVKVGGQSVLVSEGRTVALP